MDRAVTWTLRLLAAASLATSAYVHIHLAPHYAYPGTITGKQLFIGQGVVAATAALLVLLFDNKWVWALAALVGLASFAAVMSSRYLDIGAVGPLPDMRDTTWHPTPDKPLSAIVEALVVVIALVRWASSRRGAVAQPVS